MIDNIRGWGQCSLVLGLGLGTRPRTRLAVKVVRKISSLLGQLEVFSIHICITVVWGQAWLSA